MGSRQHANGVVRIRCLTKWDRMVANSLGLGWSSSTGERGRRDALHTGDTLSVGRCSGAQVATSMIFAVGHKTEGVEGGGNSHSMSAAWLAKACGHRKCCRT